MKLRLLAVVFGMFSLCAGSALAAGVGRAGAAGSGFAEIPPPKNQPIEVSEPDHTVHQPRPRLAELKDRLAPEGFGPVVRVGRQRNARSDDGEAGGVLGFKPIENGLQLLRSDADQLFCGFHGALCSSYQRRVARVCECVFTNQC